MHYSSTNNPTLDDLRPSHGVRYLMLALFGVLAIDIAVVIATLATI